MRAWAALLAGLGLGLLSGCASDTTGRKPAWAERFHNFNLAQAANVVQIDVALLERRVGDPYLNRDVWGYTDEQVVDLERKAALEENGLRVGQVVGMLPAGLHNMLTSERSCINPRCFLLPAGKERTVYLGPPLHVCRFNLRRAGEAVAVELPQAQCGLVIEPTLTGDGRTLLRFTPKIDYGENIQQVHAAKDFSGNLAWAMEVQRRHESYADLSWEVTLAPNEYLVIGGMLDRDDTLGFEAFVDRNAQVPVQRLLVLRTVRSAPGIDSDLADLPTTDAAGAPRSMPLALQATLPTARAYSR